MDPTKEVIVLKDSFSSKRLTSEEITNLLPDSYSYDENKLPTEDIRSEKQPDNDNIKPHKDFISLEEYEELSTIKDKYSDYDPKKMDQARSAANPFEEIGNSIFLNRAAIKIANADAFYNFTLSNKSFARFQTDEPLTFIDIAGGPGGFTQYIQWRKVNAQGYGMSLKHKQGSLNWKPEMLDMRRFTILDGPDGTGDLFTNYEYLINFILDKHPDGLDLAVADGGADVSEIDMPDGLSDKERKKMIKMNYRRHEYLHTRLILVQMYVAIKTLKKSCNTFIKIFDAVNPLTAQMFYLFSLCFDQVVIFKPLSSRPANAERYLMGLGKKTGKGLDLCLDVFEKALKSYTKEKEVVNLIKDIKSKSFKTWLKNQNMISLQLQKEASVNILSYMKKEQTFPREYNLYKCFMVWKIPDNPAGIRDVVPQTKKETTKTMVEDWTEFYKSIDGKKLEEVIHKFNGVDNLEESFPYKMYSMSKKEINSRFERLKDYEFTIKKGKAPIANIKETSSPLLQFESKDRYILVEPSNYDDYDNISDYFQEKQRMKCRKVYQKMSPEEYWVKNWKDVLTATFTKYKKINVSNLREMMFEKYQECETFRPSLMVGFIKYLSERHNIEDVLDISSGWGDRLIGAMAANVNYTGYDPSKDLFSGYEAMENFFPHDGKIKMVNDGFENFKSKTEYDLVLTSPPYYNLEIYEDESSKGQSIYKRTLNQWFDEFLIPSLDKAVDALRDGGFMVININNLKDQPDFVIKMVQTVSKRKDVEYLGNLPQWSGVEKKSGQPIWIWRKIATSGEEVSKKKKKTPEKEEESVGKKKKKTPEKEEESVGKKKKKTPEKEEDGYVVNPKTGKKIKIGGELHKRLIDEGVL